MQPKRKTVRMRSKALLPLVLTSMLLSACSLPDWVGESEEPPVPGTRISVLTHRSSLIADPNQQGLKFDLPAPKLNISWPQQHAFPAEHLAAGDSLQVLDSKDMGDAPDRGIRITSVPVVHDRIIYYLDGEGLLSARSLEDPDDVLWERELETGKMQRDILGLGFEFDSKVEKRFLGGNTLYADGKLFITTYHGRVHALDAKTGEEIWRRELSIPIRSAPVYDNETVYLVTSENRLYALDSTSGETRWLHEGFKVTTSIFGAPHPVVTDQLVLVPYSSGEFYALEKDTGQPRWQDMLMNRSAYHISQVAINDIDATPRVYDGSVYVVSHDGVLTAYNLDTGRKRWQQELSSVQTPWAADDFLFILTTTNELVALHTLDGRIKWITQLPQREGARFSWGKEEAEPSGEKVSWHGPVLAGGHLLVTGSHGRLLQLDPENGTIEAEIGIEGPVYLPPVVASGNVLTISNESELTVLK